MSEPEPPYADGLLHAKPGAVPADAKWPLAPGQYPLGMGDGRDGKLRVPHGPGHGALPLIVMLHGAGGDADRALSRIAGIADAALVVAPESLGQTWDVLMGGYGPDVQRLDARLAALFADWPLDPARLVIAGFSDGASYALSLAVMNGGLFTHALGFSPGFVAPLSISERRARMFVSHGEDDQILSITHCSRRFVPKLGRAGFDVEYVEFAGGHEVPEAIAERALAFLRN